MVSYLISQVFLEFVISFPECLIVPNVLILQKDNIYIHETHVFMHIILVLKNMSCPVLASDVPQPFIHCPRDINIDLPAHQNFVHVRIPQPMSNMDWWR
jgi:hypothetical protein